GMPVGTSEEARDMGARAALLVILSVLFGAAWGGSEVSAHAWEASGPTQIEARPGEFVTYTLQTGNDGAAPQTFAWSGQVPEGWRPLNTRGIVEVSPGQAEIVFFTFQVPDMTPVGPY